MRGRARGPPAPRRSSVPVGIADSASPCLSHLAQATASPTPQLCVSPGSSTAEKTPVSSLRRQPAPGPRSSKVTRARIKKSNHFASCRSHPPPNAAGRPPGSRSPPSSAPSSHPQEAPAPPDLLPPAFQELSLLTVPLACLHEVLRVRCSSKSYSSTWPASWLEYPPQSARCIPGSPREWSSWDANNPGRLCKLPPPAGARAGRRTLGAYARPPLKEIISTLPITMMSANGTFNQVLTWKGSLTYEFSS